MALRGHSMPGELGGLSGGGVARPPGLRRTVTGLGRLRKSKPQVEARTFTRSSVVQSLTFSCDRVPAAERDEWLTAANLARACRP